MYFEKKVCIGFLSWIQYWMKSLDVFRILLVDQIPGLSCGTTEAVANTSGAFTIPINSSLKIRFQSNEAVV